MKLNFYFIQVKKLKIYKIIKIKLYLDFFILEIM